jgi:flagellar protein FliL
MRHIVKIGLLLLAFLLVPPSTAVLQASSPESGHGGDAKKSEKKSDKKEAGKAVGGAIDIGPLVVNVLSNKGYKYLRLTMQVQCTDDASAERLMLPDAKEGLILLLSTKTAEELLPPAGKMLLRKELVELFGRFTGFGKVKNIYFTDVVFQ